MRDGSASAIACRMTPPVECPSSSARALPACSSTARGILRQPVDIDRARAARARADAALVEPDDAKASLAQRRDDRLPERRRAAEAGDEEEVAAVAVDMHGDLGAVLEAKGGGGHGLDIADMKVVHLGHSPKPLILRCEPQASLEGRNPAGAAPDRRCVLRGSLRSHLSMRRVAGGPASEGPPP